MRFRIILITLIAIALTSSLVTAGKRSKLEDAQERAQDAARIVTLLSVLKDNELPKELVDRSQAVGVFPKVTKTNAILTALTQGHGVISARTEDGWTMPAFYRFVGGSYTHPFAKSETNGVVLLFMTKDAVSWFEKGGVELKNERKASEGPVGTVSDEQRKQIEGAQILAYSYFNGKLSGKAFDSNFWKTFVLQPDNNINTSLYGLKGKEVLAGKKIDDKQAIPASIPTYPEALLKYYGAAKTSAAN